MYIKLTMIAPTQLCYQQFVIKHALIFRYCTLFSLAYQISTLNVEAGDSIHIAYLVKSGKYIYIYIIYKNDMMVLVWRKADVDKR